ncbi:MAG: transglycosylase SLT domain-containing protein [Alphaproteobacteria bacterium]|nr:transglycosylase SLT domain-containing protein [Alphaproteobacteria bacterium]
MSQERWDVVLRVLEGPLSLQGDLVCRGPVVRMGANPGPGGLNLSGYRGLDDRQAVISAYDGKTVSLAPVGTNQVRMAPHANVDWEELQPLRGPTYLSDGCAFHLGPAGRGVTIEFVECRRLGVWEQQQMLSDAADANPDVQPSEVKELQAGKGVPAWFYAGLVGMAILFSVAIIIPLVQSRDIVRLGPVDEGMEYYEVASAEMEVNPQLYEGFDQAFATFIQKPNAEVARTPDFAEKREYWDELLLEWVTRSAEQHLRAQAFWGRLEAIKDDYAFVVTELRQAKMPEVWASIPYQESRYRSEAQSPVCAKGYWQFMPEVARRVDVQVANCKISGRSDNWSPDRITPVRGVLKNAPYVKDARCLIPPTRGCKIDERTDLAASTRGAITALSEAFNDVTIADSGAAVQITIASHNAGYDDAKYDNGKPKSTNLLPAYRAWLQQEKLEFDPGFVGKQIRCATNEFDDNDRCGSMLHRETQHYTYAIIAQHFLAVCYYATNYPDRPEFRPWRDFTRGDGYCNTVIKVPTDEEARKWM